MVCNLKESMQTITALGSFKARRIIRRLKASITSVQKTFHRLHDNCHFDAFAVGSVQLKKSSGGPNGLLVPHAMGMKDFFRDMHADQHMGGIDYFCNFEISSQ
jgi:hypothetical protein